jgi:hypothetical protein
VDPGKSLVDPASFSNASIDPYSVEMGAWSADILEKSGASVGVAWLGFVMVSD